MSRPAFTRAPFESARIDPLLAFCAAHPGSPFPPDLCRRLMTSLVTGPDAVIELQVDGRTDVLAVAVDAVRSAADCAVLDVLGARDAARLEQAIDPLLDAAEPFIAAGPRRGLEVPVLPAWSAWTPRLEARGYALHYTSYEMATADAVAPPVGVLPGPSWSWRPASPGVAEAYHAVVHAAMGAVPGAYLSDLETFTTNLTRGAPDDLLYRGDRLVGFACGRVHGGVGHIDLIGRHPDVRGLGVGALLLTRVMRRLARGGAESFALDVTASNVRALDLYRRFGFETRYTVPVYQRLGSTPSMLSRN